jgi:hypothetical protein
MRETQGWVLLASRQKPYTLLIDARFKEADSSYTRHTKTL